MFCLNRNSGKYKSAAGQRKSESTDSLVELGDEREFIGGNGNYDLLSTAENEKRIRQALRAYTSSESELDDLIAWLRHSMLVLSGRELTSTSEELEELVKRGDDFQRVLSLDKMILEIEGAGGGGQSPSSSLPSIPELQAISYKEKQPDAADEGNTWMNEEEIECQEDNHNNGSFSSFSSASQLAPSLHSSSSHPMLSTQKRMFGLLHSSPSTAVAHESGDESHLLLSPLQHLKIYSRENSCDNLAQHHQQALLAQQSPTSPSPLPSSSVLSPPASFLPSSRASVIPLLVAARPSFLSKHHAHTLLDTPQFLNSINFETVLSSDNSTSSQVYGSSQNNSPFSNTAASLPRRDSRELRSNIPKTRRSLGGINNSLSHSSGLDLQYSDTSSFISYEAGPSKGMKRIKSEERLFHRSPLLVGERNDKNDDAIAVLSGFRNRVFDDHFNLLPSSSTPPTDTSSTNMALESGSVTAVNTPLVKGEINVYGRSSSDSSIVPSRSSSLLFEDRRKLMSEVEWADDITAADALMGMKHGSRNNGDS